MHAKKRTPRVARSERKQVLHAVTETGPNRNRSLERIPYFATIKALCSLPMFLCSGHIEFRVQ